MKTTLGSNIHSNNSELLGEWFVMGLMEPHRDAKCGETMWLGQSSWPRLFIPLNLVFRIRIDETSQ